MRRQAFAAETVEHLVSGKYFGLYPRVVYFAFGPAVHAVGVPRVFVKCGDMYRVALQEMQHLDEYFIVHRTVSQYPGTSVGFYLAFDISTIEAHYRAVYSGFLLKRAHGARHTGGYHYKWYSDVVDGFYSGNRKRRQIP